MVHSGWLPTLLRFCRTLLSVPLRHPLHSLAILLLLALAGIGSAVAASRWVAYSHFRAGCSALEKYHSLEAYDHLQASLRLWPDDPTTLFLAARAARRLGAFEEAEHYLDECKSRAGTGNRLADDLSVERVLLCAERGQVDQVRQLCQALMKQNDEATPLVLEAVAHGYMRSLRLADAEIWLNRWLEREPDNPQAFYFLGLVQDDWSRFLDAIGSYRRVLELDPEWDEARLRLTADLLDLSQAGEAFPHLEYLQRRQPDNLLVRVRLARCRDMLGQSEEAVKTLDAVLARQPHYAPALAERGRLALRSGQPVEAETWLREASTLAPTDYQVRYQLQLCLTQQGKTAEADEVLKRMKQMEDDNERLHVITTRLLSNSPRDPALLCEVGKILLRTGNAEDGLRWLGNALKENPQHAETHRALADYYLVTGNRGLATHHRALAEAATAQPPTPDPGR
jgi:tetratricopeptide (TPR) repeat protein